MTLLIKRMRDKYATIQVLQIAFANSVSGSVLLSAIKDEFVRDFSQQPDRFPESFLKAVDAIPGFTIELMTRLKTLKLPCFTGATEQGTSKYMVDESQLGGRVSNGP